MQNEQRPTFLLGASDPEMAEIERLLRWQGYEVVYATFQGKRCHPGNAYKSDTVIQGPYIAVECEAPQSPAPVAVIDHHREGDHGFGMGPDQALEGSSVGQVLQYLRDAGQFSGATPQRIRLIAASDHCPAAAYRGLVAGVSPGILRQFRAEQRGEWLSKLPPNRPERVAVEAHLEAQAGDWTGAVLAVQDETREALRSLPHVGSLVDVRGHDLAELPEVLSQSGEAALYRRSNPYNGTVKLGILGAGEGTEVGRGPIVDFLSDAETGWVFGEPVVASSAYGSPVRGYAGVTRK